MGYQRWWISRVYSSAAATIAGIEVAHISLSAVAKIWIFNGERFVRAILQKKIIEVCDQKISEKGSGVGLSFYSFFGNKNDDPELLMEAAEWWIRIHQLDHFEKAIKIRALVMDLAGQNPRTRTDGMDIVRGENGFSNCEKALTLEDFISVEQELSVKLPDDLKAHYIDHNGGTPERSVWVDPEGKWDDNEVRDFIPFRYSDRFGDDSDFTAEGRTKREWSEQQLPPHLIQFAFDWGGNYYCVDHRDGKVYFFVRDVWSDNLTIEKNWIVNTRYVTTSFKSFIDNLAAGGAGT